MLNHQDYNSLKEIIDLRRVGKFMPSFDCKNIFSLGKLNYNLNYQNLIYPYLRVNNYKNTTSKLDLIESTNNKHLNHLETKLSKKSILYRLAKGDTLMMDSVDVFDENVRALAKFLADSLTAQVTSNLYYTFKNNVGINLHFDQHDVLALQIHGKKKWNFVRNIIGDTSNSVDLSQKPILNSDLVEVYSIDLKEGEFLFVPKGVWHFTETDNENSSLHLAFGLQPPKKIDLIVFFIKSYLGAIGEDNIYSVKPTDLEKIFSEFVVQLNNEKINFDKDDLSKFLTKYGNKYTEIELT
jgi:ribosomal protein L16 Arg81 hydroxylase